MEGTYLHCRLSSVAYNVSESREHDLDSFPRSYEYFHGIGNYSSLRDYR